VEDEDYNLARAQQLAEKWAEEEQRKRPNKEKGETRKAFADAQRLADARARQDQIKRGNEVRSARDAARVKQQSTEKVRRDREAADRVRRRTMEFEASVKDVPTMGGDWNQRKTAPDNIKLSSFEAEKKAKLKRERKHAQEVDDRNRGLRHSTRKRFEDNACPVIPLRRVPRPYQQTYSSQQRSSPARSQQEPTPASQQRATPARSSRPTPVKVECASCMEPGDKRRMAVLPCKHAYCADCLSGKFPPSQS